MTSSQKLPGLIFAFYFSSNGTIEELGINQAQADYNDGWVWLHFDSSDPNTRPSLDSISSLPAPAKALLVAANERQQLYADEVCTYGALAELEGLDEDTKDIVFIPFAITKDLFISASDRQLARLQSMRDVDHLKKVSHGPTGLLERIVDQQLDDVDDYAENLAKRLDEIEDSILVDGSGNQRQSIASVRRAAVRLHRQNAISQSLVHRIECEKNARLLRFASEMAQRLDWQSSKINALRERAQLLQEETMAITADMTNSQLQILSVVATIFLPATLIAGIFGMNVKGLPFTGNSSGFLWSMLILIGASALIFWLLKRSGILGR